MWKFKIAQKCQNAVGKNVLADFYCCYHGTVF